jgi:hypothetical protein
MVISFLPVIRQARKQPSASILGKNAKCHLNATVRDKCMPIRR